MNITNEIGGVPVVELATKYGTPFYTYSQQVIEERIEELTSRFSIVRYAQKANPHLAILELMRRHGVLVDAVSAGEVVRALQAGYEPEAIYYTSDIFDEAALELVKKHPIGVNCGSPDMIRQFSEVRPGGEVILRINPGFGHGHSRKTNTGGPSSKHGIWHEELPQCMELASELGVRITGLHMHIGSGSDFEHLSKVGNAMAELCGSEDIRTICAGGGLPIPYEEGEQRIDLDHYFQVWEDHRKQIDKRPGHPVELEVEPGRYLVAEAGWLVGKIWAIKKSSEFTFYLIDTGFNHLVRPVMYGAYHPMAICPRDGREIASSQPVVVGGPLCESGDVFTQEEGGIVVARDLPIAEIGDYLVIGCTGAYGKAMASNYNSHPYPTEVWIDNGSSEVITPRQTFEEVIGNERVPGSL